MGCFSWTKADTLTTTRNIVEGKAFKMLIPQEFGGGFIKDKYQGYGRIGHKADGSPMYDMYELLAFWNAGPSGIADKLQYGEDKTCIMKEIDQYTDKNRHFGIDIGCYPEEIDRLPYPLKLVSASYKGTYEDCVGVSYGDPNQGWGVLDWDSLPSWLDEKYEIWRRTEEGIEKAKQRIRDQVSMSEYPDAKNGDIYLNPFFGDLWLVQDGRFLLINDGYSTNLTDPAGFIKVGHVEGVTTVVNARREEVRIVDP